MNIVVELNIMGNNCQPRCYYCVNDNVHQFQYSDIDIKNMKFFKNLPQSSLIIISGGEPFDNVNIYKIIEYIQQCGYNYIINTKLSEQSYNYDEIKNGNLYVSLHLECRNINTHEELSKFLDKFINNIKQFKSRNVNINVTQIITPILLNGQTLIIGRTNLDVYHEVFDILSKHDIFIIPRCIKGRMCKTVINADGSYQNDYLLKYNNLFNLCPDFIKTKFPIEEDIPKIRKGENCNAGCNFFIVSCDNNKDFGKHKIVTCWNQIRTGKFIVKDFDLGNLLKQPQICPYPELCECKVLSSKEKYLKI